MCVLRVCDSVYENERVCLTEKELKRDSVFICGFVRETGSETRRVYVCEWSVEGSKYLGRPFCSLITKKV